MFRYNSRIKRRWRPLISRLNVNPHLEMRVNNCKCNVIAKLEKDERIVGIFYLKPSLRDKFSFIRIYCSGIVASSAQLFVKKWTNLVPGPKGWVPPPITSVKFEHFLQGWYITWLTVDRYSTIWGWCTALLQSDCIRSTGTWYHPIKIVVLAVDTALHSTPVFSIFNPPTIFLLPVRRAAVSFRLKTNKQHRSSHPQ